MKKQFLHLLVFATVIPLIAAAPTPAAAQVRENTPAGPAVRERLLMDSGLYAKLVKAGLLIPHTESGDGQAFLPADTTMAFRTLRPERVAFISYPYEWCFSQLQDVALTTLTIQKAALARGLHTAFGHEHELVVVAPLTDHSGAGAAVGPVYERESIPYEHVDIPGLADVPTYGIDGSPALSVILACIEGFGPKPDLVVSGINHGINAGRSALHSGTVGAAASAVGASLRARARSTTSIARPPPTSPEISSSSTESQSAPEGPPRNTLRNRDMKPPRLRSRPADRSPGVSSPGSTGGWADGVQPGHQQVERQVGVMPAALELGGQVGLERPMAQARLDAGSRSRMRRRPGRRQTPVPQARAPARPDLPVGP